MREAAIEGIVAVRAMKGIGAVQTPQVVIPITTNEGVTVGPAIDFVSAAPPNEQVILITSGINARAVLRGNEGLSGRGDDSIYKESP